MAHSSRVTFQSFVVVVVLQLGSGRSVHADTDPPPPVQPAAPQESIFSSLKQAFKQDFEHEVIRGHFDVGTGSDSKRYYCLVDVKNGKRQPNGVPGQPTTRPDGMTGIKATSVSTYSCDSAEQQGSLVTTGYVLNGAATAGNTPPRQLAAPAAPAVAASPAAPAAPAVAALPPEPQSPALGNVSSDKLDVGGVKLGMSLEEVRAALKVKRLMNYQESADTLGHYDPSKAAASSMADRRFVNVIVAWTAKPASNGAGAAESYEVMFTPVPGKERAMGIIHAVSVGTAQAVQETALKNALLRKYGGFSAAAQVPDSATWRVQSDGTVQTGDGCSRRGLFGGLGDVRMGSATPANIALKTPPNEFQYQVDNCGIAILTADHVAANGSAGRVVTRYVISAYSPSIGFEGATSAAQLIQRLGPAATKADAARSADEVTPSL